MTDHECPPNSIYNDTLNICMCQRDDGIALIGSQCEGMETYILDR